MLGFSQCFWGALGGVLAALLFVGVALGLSEIMNRDEDENESEL